MKKSEVVRGRKKTDKGCAFRQEFVSITERMGDVPGLSHLYPWMSSSATYRKAIQEEKNEGSENHNPGFPCDDCHSASPVNLRRGRWQRTVSSDQ